MPYLPVNVVTRTSIPEGSGEDLLTDIDIIEDAWSTYPLIPYYSLDKRTTSVRDIGDDTANFNQTSGEAGASKFDPLWGESVDSTLTQWQQPQGTSGTVQANDVESFKPPIEIRARVKVVRQHQKLEKYGFDSNDKWIGSLLISIPCSLMDKVGLYAEAGDKILWDTDFYTVFSPARVGLWKNTNIHLYVNLLCPRLRHGS